MSHITNTDKGALKKYIIFKDGRIDIFDTTQIHAWRADRDEVVSAGFWNGKEAYGESTTLGVKSRAEDTNLLNNYDK